MATYRLVFTEANNGSEFRMPKCPMVNYCQFPVSKATFIDSAMYEKGQLSLFFVFVCLFSALTAPRETVLYQRSYFVKFH